MNCPSLNHPDRVSKIQSNPARPQSKFPLETKTGISCGRSNTGSISGSFDDNRSDLSDPRNEKPAALNSASVDSCRLPFGMPIFNTFAISKVQ